MKIEVPSQHFALEASSAWLVDETETEEQRATLGVYLQSAAHGIYFNVRAQEQAIGSPRVEPVTREVLVALLREQGWASPPYDEWSDTVGGSICVGATFEMTADRSGEVVLEVLVTNGQRIVNLAGPGERGAIVAVTPSVRDLAQAVRFV